MGSYYARNLDETVPALANPTLDLIEQRTSTRTFATDPVTDDERQAILHAASRAPSAGAMMFYSMVVIDDEETRRRLCAICDDQPFMMKAPFWVLFVADAHKWQDLYGATGCYDDPALASFPEHARRPLGMGDLMLGCQDAVIAAQTAVLAAESLGIGSCYIGDVIERGEEAAELLDLPAGTLPLSLLVFGHKKTLREKRVSVSCTVDDVAPAGEDASDPVPANTPHPVKCLCTVDGYLAPQGEPARALIDELDAKFTPHAVAAGAPAGERVRKLYHRKHTSDFMAEMNRSADWWVRRWCTDEPQN